ncbi:flavin reductase (NADPH)-like [Oppia nitens]|uniref:flavin reductase (NADPH)-like n=1 Tax=Oppia nitens TaxID=1686743 RepID=UPI0023DC70C4|nr:flavin reductase (NADPH)-like [Oppia nitens]
MAPVNIKKVCIFGATGNTGLCTVKAAIDKGYEVTAFVRDANKLDPNVKPQTVIVGNVTNSSDVDRAVRGQDAIVIVLGTGSDLSPTTVLSDGTRTILSSVKANNIQPRIVCCLSSFMFWERNKIPERVLNVHSDHERQLQLLKESDSQWIVACPPHIDSGPARGNYTLKTDGPVGREISKYDLAQILVDLLADDGNRIGHLVGMGYPSA